MKFSLIILYFTYKGELDKKAKERISQHLYNINYFRQNIRKSLGNFHKLSEVSIHFNSLNHSLDDLKFCIFKTNLHDKIKSVSTETKLINIFLKFQIPIINKKIPKIEYI